MTRQSAKVIVLAQRATPSAPLRAKRPWWAWYQVAYRARGMVAARVKARQARGAAAYQEEEQDGEDERDRHRAGQAGQGEQQPGREGDAIGQGEGGDDQEDEQGVGEHGVFEAQERRVEQHGDGRQGSAPGGQPVSAQGQVDDQAGGQAERVLDRRHRRDAGEGREQAEEQRVADRVEGGGRAQVVGGVQVGEGVVPVQLGGREAEHGDHPEGGGGQQDRNEQPMMG
ncbi:hypothetical protein [Acrocarpospora phusangensis]|nr:hypothetical protein [Acrocarpospora phusangensis]